MNGKIAHKGGVFFFIFPLAEVIVLLVAVLLFPMHFKFKEQIIIMC